MSNIPTPKNSEHPKTDLTTKTDGPPAPQNTQSKVEQSRQEKENAKR